MRAPFQKSLFVLIALSVVGVIFLVWKTAQPQNPEAVLEAQIEALYRSDIHGGSTPEETLALFIAALEKNDPVLASKYFELESQEEMEGKFRMGLANGSIETFLEVVRKSYSRLQPTASSQHFLFGVEGRPPLSLRFYLNHFSGTWKLGKF